MNPLHERVEFLKPGGRSGKIEQSVSFTETENRTTHLANSTKNGNNILYCIEKFQITVLATVYGFASFELTQSLSELGWSTKGALAVVETDEKPCVSEAELYYSRLCDERNENIAKLTGKCLMRELLQDPLLTKYSVIIMADVLCRSVLTDTLLALIKKILRKRSTLKVVLVTSPKEAPILIDFFRRHKEKHHDQIKSIILSVDDNAPKQDIFYLKAPCPDYVKQTIETIVNIHSRQSMDGDIIAYLVDENEISRAMQLMREIICSESINNLNYFKLSQMKSDKQMVFFPTTKGKRNVIFSTALQQTSVSEDRISYVIDCGFMSLNWFEATSKRTQRLTVPVCKFTAEVRAKWRNKHRAAKVFRLYTRDNFNLLPDRSPVEMRRTELSAMVLYLKILAVDNILRFDFPSQPPATNVLATLETLYALGAMDDQGQLTNPLGYFMAESPFTPHLSRCLFNSPQYRCSEEMLTIAVMQQFEPIFIITTNNMADKHKQVAKRAFEAAEGDLITLLNVYNAFVKNERSRDFCAKYYINYRNMMRAHKLRQQMIAYLFEKYRLRIISCHGEVEQIMQCIVSGYFMNVAYLHHCGTYRDLRSGLEVFIDRESSIYSLKQPRFLTYCELNDSSRIFMRNLTVIKEEWLESTAPHFYKRKQ